MIVPGIYRTSTWKGKLEYYYLKTTMGDAVGHPSRRFAAVGLGHQQVSVRHLWFGNGPQRSIMSSILLFFFLNIFLVIIVYAIQFVPLAFFTDAYCSIERQQVHMGRPEVHVDRLTINYPLDHVVQLVIANGRAPRIYVIRVSYIICRGVGESKTWQ